MNQSAIDQLSIKESWRMFRILAELTEGIEELSALGPCVSIFGSARAKRDSAIYAEAVTIAKLLVKAGYGVITGGGPGLMEAGNKGAKEVGGTSVGLTIDLPHEQQCNEYVTLHSDYRYFFLRKLMFVKYAQAYVVLPGGMGTIDELSEAFVLAQTERITPLPIILYKSAFWNGLLDWIRDKMVDEGFITEEEVNKLVTVCDTPEDVVHIIRSKTSRQI